MYGKLPNSYSDIYKLDQLQVWRTILGLQVNLGDKICSPFRLDKTPKCYLREYNGLILFTDWAEPYYNKYTCLHAFAHLNHCSIHDAATIIIHNDIKFQLNPIKKDYVKQVKELKNKTEITFQEKIWSKEDEIYWNKVRGITFEELEEDGVYSVDMFTINKKLYIPSSLCYAYTFPSGNTKIYQPYEKSVKWISNTNAKDVWKIGNYTDNCVITKSYKDARLIHNITGLITYAFMNEKVIPELNNWNHNKTYIIYDNDLTGITGADKLANEIEKSEVKFIPEKLGKDIDDVVKVYGLFFSQNLLKNLLQ